MWYIHTIETKAGIYLEDVDGGPETEALTCNGLSKYIKHTSLAGFLQ